MNERITLRAKSDGTEISGELHRTNLDDWYVRLAPDTGPLYFFSDQWDRVYTLPTTPGTVFRATVRGVENMRVMVSIGGGYLSASTADAILRVADIDASTVVEELKGDES